MELNGSQTHENLRLAFAAEAMASQRFLYFADVADVDGHPEVAANLRTMAETETGHASGHLDFLIDAGDPTTDQPFGDTPANVAVAIAGEAESADSYPAMASTARQEGFVEIAEWFESLARAKADHRSQLDDLQSRLD